MRRDALELAERGEFAAAVRQLRRVTTRDPGDATAHALLAHCLVATEDLGGATDAARRAVTLAPAAAFAHGALASALVTRQRYGEALPVVEEALRLDPEDADHHALLARVEASRGRWPEVLRAASRGLAMDADHAGCGNLRALALRRLGRTDDADRALRAQLAVDPKNAVALAGQGWALLRGGERELALESFRAALASDASLEWARDGALAALKARHGLYGALLRWFLWMEEQDGRTRALLIVGGLVAYNALRGLVRANPTLAPVVYPVLALYALFLFMSWLADPLFNLLAAMNREARAFLSRDQRRGALLVGAGLLAAAVAMVAAVVGGGGNLLLTGLALLVLVLPLSGVYRCEPGWPRRAAAAYAALCALLAVGSLARPTLALFGLVAAAVGSWVVSGLARVVPKR